MCMTGSGKIVVWMAALSLLSSCESDRVADGGVGGGEITFDFGFESVGPTRVETGADLKSSWEEGDQIGVFAVRAGQLLSSSGNYIHNVALTYDKSGEWRRSDDESKFFWPEDGSRLKFYAYYPYDPAATNPQAINVRVDPYQSLYGYKKGLVLSAVNENRGEGWSKSDGAIPLSFVNRMAMMEIEVNDPYGRVSNLADGYVSVSLYYPRLTGRLDLASNSFMTYNTKSEEPLHMWGFSKSGTSYTMRCVLPENQSLDRISVWAGIDNPTIELTDFAKKLTFEGNRVERFTMNVPPVMTITYTDGTIETLKNYMPRTGDNDIPVRGINKTVYSISLPGLTSGQMRTHLIGRKNASSVKMRIDADANLLFRSADASGNIPVGIYGEMEMINRDEANRGQKYIQDADIDMLGDVSEETGLESMNWTPIDRFKGFYDGANFALDNLNVSGHGVLGLFGQVDETGTVSRVTLRSGRVSGTNYVGGVVGFNAGVVARCVNGASISAAGDMAGGVVCRNMETGKVTASSNAGRIEGEKYVGGVCGESRGEISDSRNVGEVMGLSHVGGVAGYAERAKFIACYNGGEVSGVSYLGGIVGYAEGNTTLQGIYNVGALSNSTAYMGSLWGYLSIGEYATSNNYYRADGVLTAGSVAAGALNVANSAPFGAESWPAWGTSWGNTHWKSLGGWNDGNPVYPKLYWE